MHAPAPCTSQFYILTPTRGQIAFPGTFSSAAFCYLRPTGCLSFNPQMNSRGLGALVGIRESGQSDSKMEYLKLSLHFTFQLRPRSRRVRWVGDCGGKRVPTLAGCRHRLVH